MHHENITDRSAGGLYYITFESYGKQIAALRATMVDGKIWIGDSKFSCCGTYDIDRGKGTITVKAAVQHKRRWQSPQSPPNPADDLPVVLEDIIARHDEVFVLGEDGTVLELNGELVAEERGFIASGRFPNSTPFRCVLTINQPNDWPD